MAAVTTLPGASEFPADAVLDVNDVLWHAFNLPGIFGQSLMVTVADAEGTAVPFAVAWPASGAVDGGNVTSTANKRLIQGATIGARYNLPQLDDRTPRAAFVAVGLLSASAATITVTVD
jgi:hypothetical protein